MNVKHNAYEKKVNFEGLTVREVSRIICALEFTSGLVREGGGDYEKLRHEIESKIESIGGINGKHKV